MMVPKVMACAYRHCRWAWTYVPGTEGEAATRQRLMDHCRQEHPDTVSLSSSIPSSLSSSDMCVQSSHCTYTTGVWYRTEKSDGTWSAWSGTCFRHLGNALDMALSQSPSVQVTYDIERTRKNV